MHLYKIIINYIVWHLMVVCLLVDFGFLLQLWVEVLVEYQVCLQDMSRLAALIESNTILEPSD